MIAAALTPWSAIHQQSNIREELGLRMKIRSDLVEQSVEGWVSSVISADKISVQIRIRKLQKCPESRLILARQRFVGSMQETRQHRIQLPHSPAATPTQFGYIVEHKPY